MQPQNPVSPTILPDHTKSAKPGRTSFRLTRRRKDDTVATAPAAERTTTPPPPPAPPAPMPPTPALGRFAPVASGPGAALAAAGHDHTSGLERLAVHAATNGVDASIRQAEEAEWQRRQQAAREAEAHVQEAALRAESLDVADRLAFMAEQKAERAPELAERERQAQQAEAAAADRSAREAEAEQAKLRDESLDVAERLAYLAVAHAERAPEVAARAEADAHAQALEEQRAAAEAEAEQLRLREESLVAAERLSQLGRPEAAAVRPAPSWTATEHAAG
ncbi:MAG: hypothetical protein QOJ11_2376 [Frankiales bacterium]|jgi:hypothetical protein|nr:hypothetical protein [Frankiales bacterium]